MIKLKQTFSLSKVRESLSRSRRRAMRRRGTSLLEFTLAMPVVVSLTLGTWEFGFFYSIKNQIQNAAREGARAGVAWNASYADVTSAVNTTLTGCGQVAANYTITVTNSGGTTITDMSNISSGSTFTVTVSSTWGVVGSGFRPLGMISTAKTISTSCMMKREY